MSVLAIIEIVAMTFFSSATYDARWQLPTNQE
jgi:hypothetical protein